MINTAIKSSGSLPSLHTQQSGRHPRKAAVNETQKDNGQVKQTLDVCTLVEIYHRLVIAS